MKKFIFITLLISLNCFAENNAEFVFEPNSNETHATIVDNISNYDRILDIQIITPHGDIAINALVFRILQTHHTFSSSCGVGIANINIVYAENYITSRVPQNGEDQGAIEQRFYLENLINEKHGPTIVFMKSDDLSHGWAFPSYAKRQLQVPNILYDTAWVEVVPLLKNFRMPNILEHELGHLLGLTHIEENKNVMLAGGSGLQNGNYLNKKQCQIMRASKLVKRLDKGLNR